MSTNPVCSLPNQGTTTIRVAAQATEVAKCSILQGSIEVAATYEGPLNLNGIQNITGSLVVSGATGLTSLIATDLKAIGYALTVSSLPAITALELPQLETVNTITWSSTGDGFQTPQFSKLDSVGYFTIQQTAIRDLDWFKLTTLNILQLVNNTDLSTVSLPSLTGGVPNPYPCAVWVYGNGDTTVELPNLVVGSVSASGCSSLSVPVLTTANLVQVIDSPLDSLSFPSLVTSQLFIIVDNPNLKHLSVPILANLSLPLNPLLESLGIGNNPSLQGIIVFPALSALTGGSFNGTFSGVSLPALNDEIRPLSFNSSKDISTTCAHFESIAGPDNIVKGPITCVYTPESHHGRRMVGGAVGGVVALVVICLLGCFFVVMRRRARRPGHNITPPAKSGDDDSIDSVEEIKIAAKGL